MKLIDVSEHADKETEYRREQNAMKEIQSKQTRSI